MKLYFNNNTYNLYDNTLYENINNVENKTSDNISPDDFKNILLSIKDNNQEEEMISDVLSGSNINSSTNTFEKEIENLNNMENSLQNFKL